MYLRGIAVFLGLAYGLGFALLYGGLNLGLLSFTNGSIQHTLLMVVLFNLPAVFAFIAGQVGSGPTLTRVFPLPRIAVLRVIVLIPVVFVLVNFIGVLVGANLLDWRLGTLTNVLMQGRDPLPAEQAAILPAIFLVAGPLITILLGATLVAACALGHVYAWHAYLQDRLAPLGRLRAAVLGGVLWALWFAPFIFFALQSAQTFQRENIGSKLFFFPIGGLLVAIGLTAILRHAYEKSRGLALPAVILGSVLANAVGGLSIWEYLFQAQDLRLAGFFGVISAVVWCALGVYPALLVGAKVDVPEETA